MRKLAGGMGGLPTRHRHGGVPVEVSHRSAPSSFPWPGCLRPHLSRLVCAGGSDAVRGLLVVEIRSSGRSLGVSGGRAAALRWELRRS